MVQLVINGLIRENCPTDLIGETWKLEQTGKDGLAGENSLTSSSYQTSKGSTEGLFGEFWPFWE